MVQNIDNYEELIGILINTGNRDLAEKVIKELKDRGENTDLLETLLQSDS